MADKIKLTADGWIGICIVGLSGFLLLTAEGDHNSLLIPRFALSILLLLGLILFISSFKLRVTSNLDDEHSTDKQKASESNHPKRKSWSLTRIIPILLILVYYFAMQMFGFFLTTFVILSGLLILKKERLWKAFVISGVTNIFFLILFVHLVYVPLPMGVGIFRSISLFLMFGTFE